MRRRWLRILFWSGICTAIAAGVLGAVLYSAYGFVQSADGRAWLVENLNRSLSTPGESQVRIGRLEGDLLEHVELHDLSVADTDGNWLQLKVLRAMWRPAALLSGTLSISILDADGLNVLRQPAGTQSTGDFQWPELPLGVSIERFSLRNAELAQPVVGEAMAFRASGDTATEGPDQIHTSIELTRTDGISGQLKLDLLLKPRSKFLRFELSFNEADNGLVVRSMDLKDLPSLSIQIDGEGPLSALNGHVRMQAGEHASVEGRFTVDATDNRGFDVSGRANVDALVEAPLGKLITADTAFEAQGRLTDDGFLLRRGSVANPNARVELAGEMRNFAIDMKATAEVHNLATLAAIAELPLQGQATLRAHIRSADVRHAANVSASASFAHLLAAEDPLAPLAGPQVEVTGGFEFAAQQHWAVRELTVTAAAGTLNASGTLTVDNHSLAGDYRLALPDLAAFSNITGTPLAGALDISGDIGGSLDQPALTAKLVSPELSVDEILVGNLQARVKLVGAGNTVAGDFHASADNGHLGAVTAAAEFSTVAGDKLRLDNIKLQSRESALQGALLISLADATADGKLSGQVVTLAPWSKLAGYGLSGQADLALELDSAGKAQSVDLNVNAHGLNVTFDAEQSMQINALALSARIEDAFADRKGALRLVATDSRYSEARIASAALEVKMESVERLSAHIQTRGELNGAFALEAFGDYQAKDEGFAVTLSKLDALFAGQPVKLSSPARLEQTAGTTELSRSTLDVAGGHLTLDGALGIEALRARLELDGIDIAVADKFVPVADVTGRLSGHASVSGTRSAPTGSLDFKLSDVGSAHTAITVVPPISASLGGDWQNGQLQLTASVSEIASTKLDAHMAMALRLDPSTLALTVPAAEAVDGALRWSGELGPLWDLLSPYEDRLTGPGELALTLSGTAGDPKISGFFKLTGGGYENVQTGTTLKDVNLRLVGSGDKLVVETLSASDGKAGTLEGSGAIDFIPAQSYPTNLRLNFNNMLLVARDDLILNAGGHLALEGTLANALLSGKIVTGQSELLLSGTLPPTVVELEVREVDSASGVQPPEKQPASAMPSSVVTLGLNISVPGRAFVRGLGLDSEWKGDVKISGNANSPNVAGTLNPVRGQFSLMGKSFRLERGTIRFTGSNDIDPLLDLSAEHNTSGLTALVHVRGSASKPKITLTSRPSLPESEIASQVLFGTDSTNLTPGQSLQLASAIATFSGTGGAVGILDSTRRALGVDVINFGESEQDPNNTRVSVGKYVAEGVYIQVESGTGEESRTATTVEVEVLPDVRIEGGTTETGGNKVGIKWKWDY